MTCCDDCEKFNNGCRACVVCKHRDLGFQTDLKRNVCVECCQPGLSKACMFEPMGA